jgi:hypothetical protein
VRVTFDRLETGNLPPDRDAHDEVGPIHAVFSVTGGTEEVLRLDADHYPNGRMLASNRSYSIQALFDWVHMQDTRCLRGELVLCGDYSAPRTNTVTVNMGPDDDLTLSAQVINRESIDIRELLNASETIAAENIRSGSHTFGDRDVQVTVQIEEILPGPWRW